MSEKLEILKKKLLYRASYRGTKEMDILLSSFVKKYLEIFNFNQLNINFILYQSVHIH